MSKMSHCPICESEKTQDLLRWKKYTIHKCRSCQLIFSTPLPTDEELADFYQGFMFKKPEEYEIANQIVNRKKELRKLFSLTGDADALNNKKFLDYGGGTGVAFKAAKELGLDTYYHDLDQKAKKFVKDKFRLTEEKTIDELSNCSVKFDYIFSDNVIEHVKDPIAFTKELQDQLNDGGVLVIKTPHASNTDSIFNPLINLQVYFLGALKYNSLIKSIKAHLKGFWHCDPPRHLYSFSHNCLVQLVSKMEAQDIDFEISYYDFDWFANTITKQFFTKDKKLKGIASIVMRIVVLPIIPIEIFLQVTRKVLLNMKVLSPGGIILTIRKGQ